MAVRWGGIAKAIGGSGGKRVFLLSFSVSWCWGGRGKKLVSILLLPCGEYFLQYFSLPGISVLVLRFMMWLEEGGEGSISQVGTFSLGIYAVPTDPSQGVPFPND